MVILLLLLLLSSSINLFCCQSFFLIFPPDNETDHQDFPPAGDQTILFIGALSSLLLPF